MEYLNIDNNEYFQKYRVFTSKTSFVTIFVLVLQNFCENETIEFLPDLIRIRKLEHVEKYGNSFLLHCLTQNIKRFHLTSMSTHRFALKRK